jgi:tRNA U34 2-thiouridine synthase MnmA/TrmU
MGDDGRVHIQLMQDDQGIAPGQFAALYQGSVCLGGGVLE